MDDSPGGDRPEHNACAEKILDVAEDLFGDKGYDAVAISSIAERAGTSQANVIYHFKTKRDLYLAVLRRAKGKADELIFAMEGKFDNFSDFLANFARAHLDALSQNEKSSRLFLREIMGYGPIESEDLAKKVIGEGFNHVVELFREGRKEGHIRKEVDPVVATILMFGANVLFFQTHSVLRHTTDIKSLENTKHYNKKVMDILLHGLTPHAKRRGAKKRR